MLRVILSVFILFLYTASHASYESALKLFQEKKYSESLATVAKDLIGADDFKPGSPNFKLRYLAAHNHWKLGNEKSVVAHFKKCMEIEKSNPNPYIDLALYYLENKRYKEAEATVYKGLTVSKDAMLYYALGVRYFYDTNYPKAKELFEKANSINTELYQSYNALGVTLMNMQKYGEANTAFSVALAINGDSPEIYNNLGVSLERLGKTKEAVEYFKKAEAIDPNNATIKANLKRAESKK